MSYYDLREYLNILEKTGKLKRVKKEVDKDWEISAVARVAFQTIPEKERPALMFENVKGYNIPVALGVLGASEDIYALALETTPEGIAEKWAKAHRVPVEPEIINSGPCKENIISGDEIDIFKFPVPVWTSGEDPAPYLTAPFVCTKDPETGNRNVGHTAFSLRIRIN